MQLRAPRSVLLACALLPLAAACGGGEGDSLPHGALVRLAEVDVAELAGRPAPGDDAAALVFAEDWGAGAAGWRACVSTEDLLRPPGDLLAVDALSAGEQGIRLTGKIGALLRVVDVEPNAYYELTGVVRTEGLVPTKPELFFGGSLFVGQLSARGAFDEVFADGLAKVLLDRDELPKATGDTPWTAHRRVVRTAADCRALLLACVLSTPETIESGAADFGPLAVRRVDQRAEWDDLLARAVRERRPGDPVPAGWRGERLVRNALGGEARPSIVGLPGERLRLRVRVPADAPRLCTGLGEWVAAHEPNTGGVLTFTMRVEGEEVRRVEVPLTARTLEARWRDVEADLSRWAGEAVTVELGVDGPAPGAFGAPSLRGTPPGARRPNVLLVSIDTLRADHVGAYGYERNTTPHLDALAASGILFTDCTAQAPYTLPSHVSMFSGQLASVHGVQEAGFAISAARTPMLAEMLNRRGYVTQAFTGGGYVSPVFGFARGFDGYCNIDSFRHGSSKHLQTMIEAQPDMVSRELFEEYGPARIEEWITDHRNDPFFLFLHTYAVHDFDPPPGYIERFPEEIQSELDDFFDYFNYAYILEHGISDEDLAYIVRHYDAAVLYVDEVIGSVLAHLEKLGLREDTIVVVTSDHGKELTERGIIGHGVTLYEELTRVPLIVSVPGRAPAVVTTPVMSIDLAPTILAALGLPPDERMQGIDLLHGPPPPRAIWSEVSDTLAHKFAVRDQASWKLIHGPPDREVLFKNEVPFELFHLDDDPGERTNLYAPDDERSRRLARMVKELRTSYGELGRALGAAGEGGLDAVTLAQLKQLGYF